MLSNTLYRVPRQKGLQLLQKRGEGGAAEVTSWRLYLENGERERYINGNEETVLVLQQGAGTLSAADLNWRVSRSGVFTERATALYVPPNIEVIVTAEHQFEAVLVSTPAGSNGVPAVVTPGEVVVNQRGQENYSREVHDIFVRDSYVTRLMVGETFNPPGHWSSFPPHKHDGRNGEPKLEEVYHFRIDPPQGFGYQTIYTNDGESVTHQVKDRDAVLLPYGYHPVSAAPGYRLYYLWAMAGEQRALALYEDPAHKWIHERMPAR
jgi:5-deoxy-glucuronate isomerase